MPSPRTAAPQTTLGDSWGDICRQALALAEALRTLAREQPPQPQAAWLSYSTLVDEIAQLASTGGAASPLGRPGSALARKQLQEFGRLLRDRRNQAGLSRLQLARKAKLSDATIKFLETARNPPSRATLLRLVGVKELNLRWSDAPAALFGAAPDVSTAGTAPDPVAAEFSRFDPRLSLPMVLESLLVLDELRTGQYAVEVTAYGARRHCCLCGARSEAWTLDAREAVKLSLQHAAPCAGRLVDFLWQRFPVLSELAHEERRSLRSLTATTLATSLNEIHCERFFGCRSSAEVAAQLGLGTAHSPTPYRAGVGAMLLWALAVGPCPVEPTQKPFSEHRADQLLRLIRKQGLARVGESSRLHGVADAAAWLVDPQAPEPRCEAGLPVPSEASPP